MIRACLCMCGPNIYTQLKLYIKRGEDTEEEQDAIEEWRRWRWYWMKKKKKMNKELVYDESQIEDDADDEVVVSCGEWWVPPFSCCWLCYCCLYFIYIYIHIVLERGRYGWLICARIQFYKLLLFRSNVVLKWWSDDSFLTMRFHTQKPIFFSSFLYRVFIVFLFILISSISLNISRHIHTHTTWI